MSNHLLLAALAAITLAPAAMANEFTADVAVRYSDLDLSRPADVARLDRRIAAAIADVCGEDVTNHEFATRRIVAQCEADKRQLVAPGRALALETAQRARHAGSAAR